MPGAPLPNHRLKLPTAGRLVGIRAAVACPTPAGEGMTPEERVSISDLQTLASESVRVVGQGLPSQPPGDRLKARL